MQVVSACDKYILLCEVFISFRKVAWFAVNVKVNGQNNRYWSSENSHEFYEVPLHDLKSESGVQCVLERSQEFVFQRN